MEKETLQRNIRISAIIFLLTVAGMIRSINRDEVRTVTVLTIFACGMAAGALLVNYMMMRKNK